MGDRGDLRRMIGKRLLEGGQEMFRLDLVKGRHRERRLPTLQQRIVLSLRDGPVLGAFGHHISHFP
jgi:hypothetical protein